MSTIAIRHARIEDASAIASLLAQLGYPTHQENVAALIKKFCEPHAVFIAEENGNVTGVLALTINPGFAREGNRCWIDSLVVDQAQRGKGIGSLLLKHAEHYAHQNNCTYIDLISGVWRKDDGTHDFYYKHGYANEGPRAVLYFSKKKEYPEIE